MMDLATIKERLGDRPVVASVSTGKDSSAINAPKLTAVQAHDRAPRFVRALVSLVIQENEPEQVDRMRLALEAGLGRLRA